MNIAFSLNHNSFQSFLIRWGTSEKMFGLSPCSHVMVIFDSALVFHSNLSRGVHIQSLSELPKSEVIIASAHSKKELRIEDEEAIYQALVKNIVGRKYDIASMAFVAYRVILKKFFGRPFPRENRFDIKENDYCSEAIIHMNDVFAARLGYSLFDKIEDSIIPPSTLLKRLAENESMEVIPWKD